MTAEPTDDTTVLIKRVDVPPAAGSALDPGPMPSGMAVPPPPGRPSAGATVATSGPTGAAPAPVPTRTASGPGLPPPATEVITCPECGTTAQVTLNRRDSVDFCRTCDYPLFWTPSKVIRGPADNNDESLRRLPGTVGRATLASLACPSCSEPNALSAVNCVRCGRPMHPVAEAPPAPVYVPPPPAPIEPEPEAKVSWWVWALLALGAAALITLIILIATHTIN